MESFLDAYQTIRLIVTMGGLVLVVGFWVTGLFQSDSPLLNVLVLGLMAGHAAWCRLRHIRAPRAMLLIDTTLLGATLITISAFPSLMSGTLMFLALVVVLFTEGRWRVGLLAYVIVWFVTAFVVGSGTSVETLTIAFMSLTSVAAVVAVMISVRAWLGRLDAERSQMIGTVSHELRNNLTGVLGLTGTVATMADLKPAEARELVTMAHQQAVDADEIVEDLLTASRLEASALTMNSGLVDVNAEVITIVRRFKGAGREVGLALADGLPPSWADSLRVRQTLRNLLSNAIRYGGPVITIITRHTGNAIQIAVRDNGDGVPKEEEASIFLPYRRSTQGRRDASSIGLGLWICRHLAQAMGGHLVYQRREGFTEFIFTVPAARPDQNPITALASARTVGRNPEDESPIPPPAAVVFTT